MTRLTCRDTQQLLHRHDHTCYADGTIPNQRPAAPKLPAPRVERCDISDLPTDSCAHCKGHRSIEDEVEAERAARDEARRAWIPAEYPGTCGGCRHPYGPGTLIQRDPSYGWVTECCGDNP